MVRSLGFVKTQQDRSANPLETFGKAFVQKAGEGLNQFGSSLGKAVYSVTPESQRLQDETTQRNIQQADIYTKKAINANKTGDTEKAKKYFEASNKVSQGQVDEANRLIKEAEQGERDVVAGGVKTALTTLGAPTVGIGTMGMGAAFGGGIETGRQVLSGEKLDANKIAEATGSGAGQSVQTAGLTRFTNPLTAMATNKVVGGVASPITQRLAKAGVAGGANVAEDIALTKGTGKDYSLTDAATSFAIGAGQGFFSKTGGAANTVKGAFDQGLNTPSQLANEILAIKQIPGKVLGSIKPKIKEKTNLISSFNKKKPEIGSEEIKNRIARELPWTNKEDIEQSINDAVLLAQVTKSKSLQNSALELNQMSKSANTLIDNYANDVDQKIGRQPLDEVIGEIETSLGKDPTFVAIRESHPEVYQDFIQGLRTKLLDGTETFGNATRMTKINDSRKQMNILSGQYYKSGLGNESATSVKSFLASRTSKALNDILGTPADNQVKEALKVQSLRMRMYPVLSKHLSGTDEIGGTTTSMINDIYKYLKKGALGETKDAILLNSIRQQQPINKEINDFYETLRGVKKKDLLTTFNNTPTAEEISLRGMTDAVGQKGYVPGSVEGTAFDKNITSDIQQRNIKFKDTPENVQSKIDELEAIPRKTAEVKQQLQDLYGQSKQYRLGVKKKDSPVEQLLPPKAVDNVQEVKPVLKTTEPEKLLGSKPYVSGIPQKWYYKKDGVPTEVPQNIADMLDKTNYNPMKQSKVTKTSNNLYHTTPTTNLENIAKEGLVTGKTPAISEGDAQARISSSKRISFGANEETANYYGGSDNVMIRTKTGYDPGDLELDLLAGGQGTYTTGKNIPPEMLEIKVGNKWQPLVQENKLDPLLEEARKYKSAEEFVKSFQEKTKDIKFGDDPRYTPGMDIDRQFIELAQQPKYQKMYESGKNDIDVLTEIYNQTTKGVGVTPKQSENVLNKMGFQIETKPYYGGSFESGGFVKLIKDGKEIASAEFAKSPNNKGAFVLPSISIYDESSHGKGIGTALLNHIENLARERGATSIRAQVVGAPEFFNARGYRTDGEGTSLIKDLTNQAKVVESQSKSINLMEPFSKDTSKQSVTTNIQARYAKETPKVGDGRRNTSSEIVKRALETKSPTAKKRLLEDFPFIKDIEKMTRGQQERFLRATKKQRYN